MADYDTRKAALTRAALDNLDLPPPPAPPAGPLPIVHPGQPSPKGKAHIRVRKADKGRKNARAYLVQVNGARVSLGLVVDGDGWEADAQARARAILDGTHRLATACRAPRVTRVADLLKAWLPVDWARGENGDITPDSHDANEDTVNRILLWAGNKSVAEIGRATPDSYMAWVKQRGLAHNTGVGDLRLMRRALNDMLDLGDAPFRIGYKVPSEIQGEKQAFLPWEFDRVLLAALGYRYADPETLETVVDPATDARVLFRHSPEEIARRAPFYVALLIAVTTGSRQKAICELSWGPYLGGPHVDLVRRVLNRQGTAKPNQKRFRRKRRGVARLPAKLVEILAPIAAADLEDGCLWVIHDAAGNPLKNLPWPVWRDILKDACVAHRRWHCTKDTSIDVARHGNIPIQTQAVLFQTTTRTIDVRYGSDADLALQAEAADVMGAMEDWRRNHEAEARRLAAAAKDLAGRMRGLLPSRKAPIAAPGYGATIWVRTARQSG